MPEAPSLHPSSPRRSPFFTPVSLAPLRLTLPSNFLPLIPQRFFRRQHLPCPPFLVLLDLSPFLHLVRFLSSLSPALDFFFSAAAPLFVLLLLLQSIRSSLQSQVSSTRKSLRIFIASFIRFKRERNWKNIFLFAQIHARAIFFLHEPFEIKILIFDRKKEILYKRIFHRGKG